MTRPLGGLALAAAALVVVAGCDLRQLALESELAPGVRDQIVRECCECLARNQAVLVDGACGDEEPGATDAGPVGSPCLCGVPAGACAERLIAGEVVEVVGGCTAAEGTCHDACEGVLAYPP